MKKDFIEERVLKHAREFIKRDETVRSVAKKFGWSKATVHTDLIKRLPKIHKELAEKVKEKMNENKIIGYMKGGYATQEKWIKIKERREKKE